MANYLAPGVYVEEVPSGSRPIEGVGTAVAGFVGFAEKGPLSQPTLITNWTQFTRTFGGFVEGVYLAHSVYAFFLNGGGSAYVLRLPGEAGESSPPPIGEAVIPAAAGGDGRPAFAVRAIAPGAGEDLTVAVAEAGEPADGNFRLDVLRNGKVEESFDNVTVKRGPNNVAAVVAKQSKLITLEHARGETLSAPRKDTTTALATREPAPGPVLASAYVGDPIERTGIGGFEAIDEITMVLAPDLMSAYQRGQIDADGVKAVQLAMIAHCELMSDRVAILDPPPGLNSQQMRDWRSEVAGYDSKYAALYWPWVQTLDPASGSVITIPPSGQMAGIWGRSDENRGVHKAPANEVVRGVVGLQTAISRAEQELLNPLGVNCIRAFPGQGIRVWGARTLSSDPEWRYINVRRLFNFVEESILQGTSWVVFEPNDEYLWTAVRRVVGSFLQRIWRSGALAGRSAAEAYYVKCDEENNPPESRDAGHLFIEIGIAPVKPAEFVVFQISQLPQGAALEE
ncbi:phage tail sheath subtilisin-like domain-containing protein [Amycolatopsis sp. PS_44_ISF1]|uniref:phage tail sheath family protein n=1 Tax=Amycolatopsis sp. PS_44_ISF1 TaxID=2974917 RepID=UPI0028DD5454|nr:phage tail sheath subtilisin-like domain-containing protein [Amycolatopsis sp. PS_44_ISF1]MDT8913134.1 phage tail sheath subtilisin-like domain-containing protein [Amycolatopsis sp. PS_44_ISF1]MDT8916326.1 phage tail sheath subtilisin-like domain-containing protein [Amycolatopsis sp. PS_44_ISF1]MDT8916328.1 phage tail sheath subtilisin-like domain-containing protein [Amycolatopsis sp. PS_44_ISF1]